jgi:hypothetical protein
MRNAVGERAVVDAEDRRVIGVGASERTATLRLHSSRVLTQEGSQRDWKTIRHINAADRIANRELLCTESPVNAVATRQDTSDESSS